MTQFLYFVPTEQNQLSAKDLRQVGLGYLGVRGNVTPNRVAEGPGGKSGISFSGDGKDFVKYKPAEQTWIPGPDGKYFVGYANAATLPGPEDLKKPRFVTGEPVELGEPIDTADGEQAQIWTIPICLSLTRGVTIPRKLAIGEDGKSWTLKELPEFTQLCAAAEQVYQAVVAAQTSADGKIRVTLADEGNWASMALAVNYRLSPIEISLLGLLTSDNAFEVLWAMIDGPEYQRVQQAARLNDPEAGEKKDGTPGI